jgi:hypothetical protein
MKWMAFLGKVRPPNPKRLIFEYSSKELHFFFFLLWTSNHQTQLNVMRQNKSLARTLHLVLIALRGFSVYILFSLSSFSVVAFALYWALHTPNTRIPPHTASRQRRTNDTSKGQEQGRDGSQDRQAKGGGFRERERKRGPPPPAATATESSSVPNWQAGKRYVAQTN